MSLFLFFCFLTVIFSQDSEETHNLGCCKVCDSTKVRNCTSKFYWPDEAKCGNDENPLNIDINKKDYRCAKGIVFKGFNDNGIGYNDIQEICVISLSNPNDNDDIDQCDITDKCDITNECPENHYKLEK